MVYVLLGTGFEEIEALTPVDLLRRGDVAVATVGIDGKVVVGSHGIPVTADLTLAELDRSAMDMVVLPGGLRGVASVRACPEALETLRYGWEQGKYVAAICAGPTVLADLGITDGRHATCYPGCVGGMGSADVAGDAAVVEDGRLITGTSAGCSVKFALALVKAMAGEETAQRVAQQIVIR